MATPNYGYEKRQRELAKKQKKEEKARAKADRKLHGDVAEGGEGQPQAGGDEAADAQGAAGGEGASGH